MATPANAPKSFYSPGTDRAQRVEDLFGKIAGRYDLINDLQSFGLHRLWKRKLLALAELRPDERALDLCCGTGDIAFRLERRGLATIGLDFSEPMLAVARARQPSASTIAFLRGDALRLPFRSEAFDVVTIGYGLRNLSDLRAGLAEMNRVLKPGGRMLILDFARPPHPLWRALYFAYLKSIVPIFGAIFCGNAATHAYILQSLLKYPDQHAIVSRMSEAGCAEVRFVNLLGGIMSIHAGKKTPKNLQK